MFIVFQDLTEANEFLFKFQRLRSFAKRKPILSNVKKLVSYFALALILVVSACENPVDDFVLAVNPTFYKYVVEVNLEEITGAAIDPNESFTITLGGKDGADVFNIDGTKNYAVNFGTAQFIIASANEPSPGNPVDFTVNISSNTYRTTSVPIRVESEDFFINEIGYLIDNANLPPSVGVINASGDVSTGALTSPVVLNAQSTDGTSKMELTLDPGIGFKDESGLSLSGALDIEVLSFSDLNQETDLILAATTPPLILLNGVLDTMGQTSMPSFEINMTVGGAKVSTFSGGQLKTRVPIGDELINPFTNQVYIAGDTIGLASYTEGDATWQSENDLEIKSDANGLYVEAEISHLSTFSLRKWSRQNPGVIIPWKNYYINFKTDNPNVSISSLKAKINFTSTEGRRVKSFSRTRSIYNINNTGVSHRFAITKFSDIDVTSVTTDIGAGWTSSAAIKIGNTNTWEITLTPPPGPPLTVQFNVICGTTVVNPPAGTKMYYRPHDPSNNSLFDLLHIFTEANQTVKTISTTKLSDGQVYDFRAQLNTTQYDSLNVQVINNKVFNVNVPQTVCNQIGL